MKKGWHENLGYQERVAKALLEMHRKHKDEDSYSFATLLTSGIVYVKHYKHRDENLVSVIENGRRRDFTFKNEELATYLTRFGVRLDTMSDIEKPEVYDRVRFKDRFGWEHTGTIVSISNYREPQYKYAIDADDFKDDYIFVGSENIIEVID